MIRRKGVPCSCESDSLKCGNKVRKIDGISPDPNGDFIIEAGNGIGISTGENKITIINQGMASSFVAGDNIEINPSGDDLEIRVTNDISVDNVDVAQDVNIGGDLKVTGDIIQQGSSYETHAEQIYTTKDYIYMREGAVGGLGVGDYSGFEVIKYDGTNDGRLVIDKDGVARVGDVGDEQPLLTRDESSDLTNGDSLIWDSANSKAITQAIPSAIGTALAGKQATLTYNYSTATINGCVVRTETYGRIIVVSCQGGNPTATGDFEIGSGFTNNPFGLVPIVSGSDGLNPVKGYLFGLSGKLYARFNASGSLDVGFRFVGIKD